MPPKVSICIPAYKQIEYLRKTLDSVISQHFDDYELIITDDSPDNSVEKLISSYSFGNKLKYYKNKPPLGSPENWNEAVRRASGEYIKILHHDDWFTYPESLAEFVALLDTNPDLDFAFSAAIAISINSNKTWVHSPSIQQLQRLKEEPKCLFFGNFIGPPSSTIYRRKGLEYDRNLKWVVDFDFYIQYLLSNNTFSFTDRPLVTSISGANHNVTGECENNKNVEIFEYLYLLNKIYENRINFIKPFLFFFRKLFYKYNINSIHDIRQVGFSGKLPLFIKLLLFYRKFKYVFWSK